MIYLAKGQYGRLLLTAMLILGGRIGQASVVFDNGSYGGSQVGRNLSGHIIFEDFQLNDKTQLTRLDWSQHDALFVEYQQTIITFYYSLPASIDSAESIYSVTVKADRVANGSEVLFDHLYGFDYSVSLDLMLDVGIYWFSLTTTNTSGGMTWDQTINGANMLSNRYQIGVDNTGAAPIRKVGENSVFTFYGNSKSTVSVPEPSTFLLLLFPALGYTCRCLMSNKCRHLIRHGRRDWR